MNIYILLGANFMSLVSWLSIRLKISRWRLINYFEVMEDVSLNHRTSKDEHATMSSQRAESSYLVLRSWFFRTWYPLWARTTGVHNMYTKYVHFVAFILCSEFNWLHDRIHWRSS